jgi:hypothetical protein
VNYFVESETLPGGKGVHRLRESSTRGVACYHMVELRSASLSRSTKSFPFAPAARHDGPRLTVTRVFTMEYEQEGSPGFC